MNRVKEEIKLAQETSLTSFKGNSRNEIHPSESKIFQLCFLDKLSLPVLTGIRIQGEKGTSIRVALVDGLTKKIVNSGPEASAKVEIVVIEGDFDDGEGHYWTIEEFNQKIVRERKGKKCFLIGDAFLNMKGGLGTVGDISVTHNSIWMKNGEFRLGARVVDDFSGTRVREAISEPFILKDRRSSLYEKHYPPLLSDEVWRLKKIAKDGTFHERLSRENITSVKEFLTLFFINPQRLHDILGGGTKSAGSKIMEIMIDHARTCILDKRVYLYRASSQEENGVVFNVVGQLMGLLLECQCVSIDALSETKKADAQHLVVSALEHRDDFFTGKKHREDFVSFDDITSLIHACSETHPSNSSSLENPCGHYSDTQPSTSSLDVFSYIRSTGDTSNMDDCGVLTIDGMDFTVEQLLSDPGEAPNSPGFDPSSMIQDFDEHEDLLFRNYDYDL
ncbi:calmodulin-binding protein 60 A-like isoform X2 [Cornus florida]|uniref:calmodulin-binding protein 60 A-like isoform X2 n=1 Tax=Cornus florida TaxID=4283 RepID=UPI00289D0AC6|nr:calmodulin-binding protein 60 A-like isoform X2 [Cornus florida]